MKNILKIMTVICLLCATLVSCDDMNSMHDKYLQDGEIIYVAKFDSIKFYSGIERLVIHYWLSDPQVKYTEIKWDLGRRSQTFEVGMTGVHPGILEVKNITEGQVTFELYNTDAYKRDKSIMISKTVTIYGDRYQEALDNRIIRDYDYKKEGDPMKIYWIRSYYEGSLGTELTYYNSLGLKCVDTIARPHELVQRPDPNKADSFLPPLFGDSTIVADILDGSYFTWRNVYMSETSIDITSSSKDSIIVRPAIRVNYITLDRSLTQVEIGRNFTLRATVNPADAFNKTIIWSSSDAAVARVSNGLVSGVSQGNAYITARSEDGLKEEKCFVRVNARGYVDLDRSNWFAEPERDEATGAPLTTVNHYHTSAPTGMNANEPVTVKGKIKSPYLSHFLPWANAAMPGSGDALNTPSSHFDNRSGTYLGMVKGIGGTATGATTGTEAVSGTAHAYQGIGIYEVGEKPWFIIRLDETTPQKFNYFRIRFRENGGSVNLKPHGLSFFGSNYDDCITNNSLWVPIGDGTVLLNNKDITTPNYNTATNNDQFLAGAGLETGNQNIGDDCEYKYIKVQYERWMVDSQSMSIAEFYLGWHDYD